MSVRESILAELTLRATTALAGVSVSRSRQAPATRAEGPVLVVEPEEESARRLATGMIVRNFTVVFALTVRGTVPDTTADPYLVSLHAALASDPTLGGLCAEMQDVGTKWDFDLADVPALRVEVRYSFSYLTSHGSL